MTLPHASTSNEVTEVKVTRGCWRQIVLLLTLGIAVFANSLNAGFAFDDHNWIDENPHFVDGFSWKEILQGPRPVLKATLEFNHSISLVQPWSYHVLNLLIHLAASLLLFGIVRRTWTNLYPHEEGSWLAFAVASLWMVHPVQVQSVTYVIQRSESLMGLFYLLALYGVLRGALSRRHSWIWYLLGIAGCWLGMGTKAVMVSAFFVIPGFDRVYLASSWREVLRKRWWVYLGFIASCTLLRGHAALDPESSIAQVGLSVEGITPWQYALTQSEVVLFYLRLVVWPNPLVIDYLDWPVAVDWQEVWPAGLLVTAIVAGTIYACWRWPRMGFPALCFFLLLAPTSSIMPIVDVAFEHRLYLALAPALLLLALAVYSLVQRLDRRGVEPGFQHWHLSRTGGMCAGLLLAGVLAALSVQTVQRNSLYHDEADLWGDTVAIRPGNARAQLTYGLILRNRNKLEESVEHLRLAFTGSASTQGLKCHFYAAQQLALLYERLNRHDEAIALLRNDVAANPLAVPLLEKLAKDLWQQGQAELAAECYRVLIGMNPDRASYHYGLAAVLFECSPHESRQAFAQGKNLDPKFPAQARAEMWKALTQPSRNFMKLQAAQNQAYWLNLQSSDDSHVIEAGDSLVDLAIGLASNDEARVRSARMRIERQIDAIDDAEIADWFRTKITALTVRK